MVRRRGETGPERPAQPRPNQPTFAEGSRTVTVRLRPYSWSDGTQVTADGIAFWMNMMEGGEDEMGGVRPGGSG